MAGKLFVFRSSNYFFTQFTNIASAHPAYPVVVAPTLNETFDSEISILPVVFNIDRHETVIAMILECLGGRYSLAIHLFYPIGTNHPEDSAVIRDLFRFTFRQGGTYFTS